MKADTMTAKHMRDLNKLTNGLTAFHSWEEFRLAMDGGYVPSIYTSRGNSYKRLASLVRLAGYRVFDGVKVK